MNKLIIVRGFAQAGKSTAVNYLVEEHGFYNASTSKLLGKLTEKLVSSLAGMDIDTSDKEQVYMVWGRFMDSRGAKIKVAEDCIAPVLGRLALMAPFFEGITNETNVVYECFNDEELEIFLKYFGDRFDSTLSVNIRRDTELTGVDKRTLDPEAETIDNNWGIGHLYSSLDDLANAWGD